MSALSARADGEGPDVDELVLDAHVAGCPVCRDFEASAESMRRAVRLHPASTMPDLSRQIVKVSAANDRADHSSVVRGLLFVTALLIVVLSIPDLLTVDDAAGARHLGAFCIAYAGGLLLVVFRPARARTMFDVSIVLMAALLVTVIVNVVQGRGPLVGGAAQLPDVLSVGLLWLLARPRPDPLASQVSEHRANGGGLRLIENERHDGPST
jgi:anti-sigma factor RsiW